MNTELKKNKQKVILKKDFSKLMNNSVLERLWRMQGSTEILN